MKKFVNRGTANLTRDRLANPFLDEDIMERYKKAKVIDMRDNHVIEKTQSGYLRIRPIDPNKTY